ncbi:hypothetical protein D3C73_597920 [compost metagenome]
MNKPTRKLNVRTYFTKKMEKAHAGFEFDCQQACRALKVCIAVNVFGVGTLLPNALPLADDHYARRG